MSFSFTEAALSIVQYCRILYVLVLYSPLIKMVNITNAREYLRVAKQKIRKSFALRKQVLMACRVIPDEVIVEPEKEVSECAGCDQESKEDEDSWIQCTRCVCRCLTSNNLMHVYE
jgi:hypothetical protein